MSPESSQPEFRHYRLTLGAIVFGLTTLAVVWLASSVAVALFVRPRVDVAAGERFSGRADDVEGMLRCARRLDELLAALDGMMGRIATQASGSSAFRQEFEQDWPDRWRKVGAGCRFEELRDRGLGATYDHLAWVHATLQEEHRGDAVLLESYMAHHEPRVNDLRRALEASEKALERKRAAEGGTRPG